MSAFSTAQVEQYLDHIQFPRDDRPIILSTLSESDQLKVLTKLLRQQICHVPFENLDLHYSPVKGVSLDPTFLFHKIVSRKAGRGGYCMQNNSFFANILRAIGFRVRSVGARVAKDFTSPDLVFGGWSHQVNIITVGSQRYLLDVGFGNEGPTYPMHLDDKEPRLLAGVPDKPGYFGQLRKLYDEESGSTSYVYQISHHGANPYTPRYCFTTIEFSASDFEIMSFHVANSRTSLFVNHILCSKFIMSEDGEYIMGDMTLFDSEFKKRVCGTSHVLADIKIEQDRVQALEHYMNIKLLPEEAAGVKGLPTALTLAKP